MLFTQWQEPLQEHYQFIKRDVLTGGDTHTQMGDVVLVKRMTLNGLNYDNMTFRFNDIGGNSGHTMPFDGLLGYDFLASRPTAIEILPGTIASSPIEELNDFEVGPVPVIHE